MLNYWHKIHSLTNDILVKKALLENVEIRTPWIQSIEKLLTFFNITYSERKSRFSAATKLNIRHKYNEIWSNSMTQEENSRLIFYRKIKNQFKLEEYLNTDYETRSSTARMKTSSHSLEIETGKLYQGQLNYFE